MKRPSHTSAKCSRVVKRRETFVDPFEDEPVCTVGSEPGVSTLDASVEKRPVIKTEHVDVDAEQNPPPRGLQRAFGELCVDSEASATITGIAADRHGCTHSEMPEPRDDMDWRPVSLCRELRRIRFEVSVLAGMAETIVRDDPSLRRKTCSRTGSQDDSIAERLRAVEKRLATAESAVDACVFSYVKTTMACSRISELCGNGPLLTSGSRGPVHVRGTAIVGEDGDASTTPSVATICDVDGAKTSVQTTPTATERSREPDTAVSSADNNNKKIQKQVGGGGNKNRRTSTSSGVNTNVTGGRTLTVDSALATEPSFSPTKR